MFTSNEDICKTIREMQFICPFCSTKNVHPVLVRFMRFLFSFFSFVFFHVLVFHSVRIVGKNIFAYCMCERTADIHEMELLLVLLRTINVASANLLKLSGNSDHFLIKEIQKKKRNICRDEERPSVFIQAFFLDFKQKQRQLLLFYGAIIIKWKQKMSDLKFIRSWMIAILFAGTCEISSRIHDAE